MWTVNTPPSPTRDHRSATNRKGLIVPEAYGYTFVPVVHGFRLGNGDLLWSILMWGADGRISRGQLLLRIRPL
jgi:hypothetical protein